MMKFLYFFFSLFFAFYILPAFGSTTLPPLQTYHHWIINNKGQVVILRGVNLVIKSGKSPQQAGFDKNNIALLQKQGFNVVRLGVLWNSVEPQLHHYNEKYLADIKQTVHLLAQHGIYTLIDFHQDQYSQLYGDGAPGWATSPLGTHIPNVGFPCNLFGDEHKIRTDIDNAYTAFWNNARIPTHPTETLQNAYMQMVGHVVQSLQDEQDNLLGFDLMNEPFIGNHWQSCIKENMDQFDLKNLHYLETHIKLGCQQFDQQLTQFYQRLIKSIRKLNKTVILWYETNLLHGFGATVYLGKIHDKQSGLSFHNYDQLNVNYPIEQALRYQKKMDVPLLEGEYGATTNLSLLKKVTAANNQAMLSSIYWAYANDAAYRFCAIGKYLPSDPRRQGIVIDLMKPLMTPNLNAAMLNALTEVYPQYVSGTPIQFSYDQNKKIFQMKYSPINPLGKRVSFPTQIYIPLTQFPNGYKVIIQNGVVISDKNSEHLLVKNNGDSIVSIHIFA